MTTRVRLSRMRGAKLPPGTVVVSRPSRWGNPIDWRTISTRSTPKEQKYEAARQFDLWLDGVLFPMWRQEQRRWILENMAKIRDAEFIACWCGENEKCHGDVLIKRSLQ
jgi:hypothetical protein